MEATRQRLHKRRRASEILIQGFLVFCGAISVLTTLGIVLVLGRESWLFFGSGQVDLREFFTNTVWQPTIGRFGILPLVNATF
ncbi:MAG: phosphate ABC transporter permease subunit PstC, partial [Chloroflexi bacterium]|nr:phosphate ABC transporter permease subunit PstC [Chloroflexota bacterium]